MKRIVAIIITRELLKYALICRDYFPELQQDYDDNLFTIPTRKNHAMHHLLPSPKSTCYNLRSLGHGLSVSLVKFELHKKSFINRVLFSECY